MMEIKNNKNENKSDKCLSKSMTPFHHFYNNKKVTRCDSTMPNHQIGLDWTGTSHSSAPSC